MYLVSCSSKGISSVQLARDLDVTQKTAWFILCRIREMLKEQGTYLTGDIECDETWVGGKEKNKHWDKKASNDNLTGESHFDKKTPVLGILQRNGMIVVKKVEDVSFKSLTPIITNTVSKDSRIFTDEGSGYSQLKKLYKSHKTVTHSNGEYVNGIIHCNGVENFWSIFKRGINGIYHQVSEKHMDKYCNEYAFRFNYRKDENRVKFGRALSRCNGRLTYATLIAKS
jgi:transposase-like protein